MEAFRPIRYWVFRAREKSQRGSDTMNAGTVKQKISQVHTQLFLAGAGERDDHVLRTAFLDLKEQRVLLPVRSGSRDMAIVWIDRKTAFPQPVNRFAFGSIGRNDKEEFLLFRNLTVGEQTFQIADSRNLLEAATANDPPEKRQQFAVCEHQISSLQGEPVFFIIFQLDQGRRCGDDNQAAFASGMIDGVACSPIKERNTQDSLVCGRGRRSGFSWIWQRKRAAWRVDREWKS